MNRRTFLCNAAAAAALPLAGRVRANRAAPAHVNGDRLNSWLAAFNGVGRTPGGINRVAYSEADLAGRAFTLDLFRQSGLAPRIDAAGNIIARVPGSSAALPPILIGSHIDSVTDGGNYDGPVGSFGAIEVARTLREKRIATRHPVDVVVWQNEEGGTIGSKLAIGAVSDAELDKVARSGKTVREGIALIGGTVAQLSTAVKRRGDIACYIELHIEQGGNLERSNTQIGVVQGIVGLRWTEVTITGMANHAGATPMDRRQDAMLAAAKFTVAITDAIRAEPGRQVATVGRLVAQPNTTNVIAGQVVLTVDLRDLSEATLQRFTARFEELAGAIGRETQTTFAFRTLTNSAPALADERIMGVIDSSAAALGLSRVRMPSGAGHDAQEIAHIAPMGMIFIPSIGGISHSPREFSTAADITRGADVLLNAVMAVDALV
jgi:beta-ureidopropionase / N-carbamoyl-L-amino-acid hydrolase